MQEFCQQRFFLFNYTRGESRQLNAEVLLVSAACLISHKMWAALLGWKMLNSTFSLGHISALEIALDDLLATEDLDRVILSLDPT